PCDEMTVDYLHFYNDYYSSSYKNIRADIVVCRHVLEHVPNPIEFLESLREIPSWNHDTVVYFEVPNGMYSFADLGIWDFIYEHISYFCGTSLRACFERAGLRVSALEAGDLKLGFLLLEDFGDETWATYRVSGGEMQPLFDDALRQLHLLQASDPEITLPLFDVSRMQRECDLYLDWYLPRVAGETPSENERGIFRSALAPVLKRLAALPCVPVHLDYHSRNLMLPNSFLPLGQIDYQDAVLGPVTYDPASLLYDCYQNYPENERRYRSRSFFEALPEHLSGCFAGFDAWHRDLRLTALQRHIKAIGIFARLAHRDGKTRFLDEIPLTRQHLMEEMEALNMSAADFPLLYAEPLPI
ncbi:MAG: phosphotransferase, partial [Mariprofundus sp.]|nr:phosphotransferase [Mariprofundus sp.]